MDSDFCESKNCDSGMFSSARMFLSIKSLHERGLSIVLLMRLQELEMHKKLRTAWDLLMRGEGIELPRATQVLESTTSTGWLGSNTF